MPVDLEFYEMMPHTVTVYASSTLDKYGKQAHSATGTAYRCRLVWDQRMIRSKDDREVLEAGRAIVYGVATVDVNDRVTLPSGESPLVTSVSQLKDQVGDHHTVIGFGG
jgi:hypothetical protein